jgi:hypothetical protein
MSQKRTRFPLSVFCLVTSHRNGFAENISLEANYSHMDSATAPLDSTTNSTNSQKIQEKIRNSIFIEAIVDFTQFVPRGGGVDITNLPEQEAGYRV